MEDQIPYHSDLLQEPAWVRANRMKNATQAQDVYSKRLLRSISREKDAGEENESSVVEKEFGVKKEE